MRYRGRRRNELSTKIGRHVSVKSSLGVAVVGLGLVVACSSGEVARPTTLTTPVSLPESTTTVDQESSSTTAADELTFSSLDLLDGSTLEVVMPSELQLTGYFFVIEVPEIRSSNVDLSRGVDPADAGSVDHAAVLESNLGNGVRLWRADREGEPLYLSVDLGGWGAVFHVGNETAPDTELLRSLAAKLEGVASENGVILTDYEPGLFTTHLSDPQSQNQVHLAANQCVREVVPDADVVDHPVRGDLIRGPGYASWCDEDADLEVIAYGDDEFVKRVVSGMALVRNRQTNP